MTMFKSNCFGIVFRCSSSAAPDVMINTEVWVPSAFADQYNNWIQHHLVDEAGTISSHGRYCNHNHNNHSTLVPSLA